MTGAALPGRMRGRWRLALLAAAVLLGLVAAFAWLAARPPEVEAVALREAPLVRTLQFSGRVATLSRVDVGSTLTGRVAAVAVAEGARVRRGQVLLRLESDELSAAVAQAVAAEQQAQARLAGLRSTGRASAAAVLDQAEATLRAAEAEFTRAQQLVAQGFVSASRLDDARRALDVARGQQAAARSQRLALEEQGTDAQQAQAQWAQARATSAVARARLAQTLVLSPADAQVLVRSVEPGQIVQPGRTLLALALAGPTQLVAQVDERFLDQLRPGQQASVAADAFPGRVFPAQVLSLAPSVDAQRGAVEVKLLPSGQAPDFLREDMTLSVEVVTGRTERAVALPLAALRAESAPDRARVLVAAGGQAEERTVRLGLRTLDAVQVTEGLAAGEVVITARAVRAGDRVRVRTADWQPGASALRAAAGDVGTTLGTAMGR